jgi:DNA-binding NtrC family response regulator
MAPAEEKKISILLADDDEVDRRSLIIAMGPNAQVDEVQTGREALLMCGQKPYDCIILDHLLPDYDSFQLIPEIRKCDPFASIIVVTGYGDELLAVKMLKAGALNYIPKDKLSADLLKSAISEALIVHKEEIEANAKAVGTINSLQEISQAATQRAHEIHEELLAIPKKNDPDSMS